MSTNTGTDETLDSSNVEHTEKSKAGDAAGLLVKQWIVAFNAHNAEELAALYAEDAELFDTGMKRARHGRDEIRQWFVQRFQSMPTLQYRPYKNFEQAEEAVICWIARGETPPLLRQSWLSRPFEVEGVSIFRFSADLIQWQHGYYDHLAIVEKILPPLRWLPLKL